MTKLKAAFLMTASAVFFIASAHAQTVPNHAFALGKGPGVTGYGSLLCGAGQVPVGQAGADPQCVASLLRTPSPVDLYVATTGSDSNSCSSGSQCQTIQRAVNVAFAADLQGAPITIHLAAGTYTKAAYISGTLIGNANGTYAAPMLKIAGVAGSTIIDPSTNCGAGASPLTITNGAIVGIGSVKLQTSCTSGNGLFVNNGGVAYLVDGNVNFGAAVNALLFVGTNSRFDANYGGAFGFTISGGANYGIAGTTHAIVVTGIGITNTIVGTPSFPVAFISMIDGSFYNEGINSSWSGAANATGTRYSIALNSHIDREQNAGNLPGSLPGLVQGVSVYYQNNAGTSDLPCVGGASGCRNTTAPTGLGTGGSAAMFGGSNDHSGAVALTMGTSPPGGGSVVVAPVSVLNGDYGQRGFCAVTPNDNAANWPANTVVQHWFDNTGIHIAWTATVSASATYYISYVCG